MVYIPQKLRQKVIERAKECCEYCQTQMQVVVELQVDHIHPVSKGGMTELDNLCLACSSCNLSKGAFLEGFDAETQTDVPLFNPRNHQWADHFEWDTSETKITGLTPIGRVTITRLDMNRDSVVRARILWKAAGWHPPK